MCFVFIPLSVVNTPGLHRPRTLCVHVLPGRPRDCLSLCGGLGRPDGDIGETGNEYEDSVAFFSLRIWSLLMWDCGSVECVKPSGILRLRVMAEGVAVWCSVTLCSWSLLHPCPLSGARLIPSDNPSSVFVTILSVFCPYVFPDMCVFGLSK